MTFDPTAPLDTWMPTVWYGGYLPGLPDLCVGRWPDALDRSGAARWKIWIVTTPDETAALTAALARPVPRVGHALDFASGPDAAVSKPVTVENFVALYHPPQARWPFITLTSLDLPAEEARAIGLARLRFGYEIDDGEPQAMRRIDRLRAIMDGPVYVPGGQGH